MKSKMKKKMIAFLLCMVLVICNSVSILADTPAAETTTTEQKAKETRTAKSEGTSEEEKSSDNSKDTSKSSEETEETKEEAPETKTTEKKEETTGATTEKKEESTTATTTEKKEETEESSETSEKKETEEAEETATTGSEKETSETAEETTESKETSTEETGETTQSPAYNGKYEDSTVTISVSAEAGIVPEGAELSVTPIEKTKITDSMSDEDAVAYCLSKHPDLKGCFGTNVNATQLGLKTLKNMDKIDDVVLMGFDAGAEQIEALQSGEIDGLVVQNPFGIGYAAVVASARTVLEIGNEAEVNTGYVWVDQENMEEKSVQAMLYE